MKISDGFFKTTLSSVPYVLPYGQNIADHARSLRLNESGALYGMLSPPVRIKAHFCQS